MAYCTGWPIENEPIWSWSKCINNTISVLVIGRGAWTQIPVMWPGFELWISGCSDADPPEVELWLNAAFYSIKTRCKRLSGGHYIYSHCIFSQSAARQLFTWTPECNRFPTLIDNTFPASLWNFLTSRMISTWRERTMMPTRGCSLLNLLNTSSRSMQEMRMKKISWINITLTLQWHQKNQVKFLTCVNVLGNKYDSDSDNTSFS